jgi:hypothetical protein
MAVTRVALKHTLLLIIASALCAAPLSAAMVALEFTGRLNIVSGGGKPNVNFFTVDEGDLVTGRFLFDMSKPPTNVSGSKNTTVQYSSGVTYSRELNWISTEFDQGTFDFSRRADTGLDKDTFLLENKTAWNYLGFVDKYKSSTGGTCGSAYGPAYCWGVSLSASLTPATLALTQWPQNVSLAAADLVRDKIGFNLYNSDTTFGPTGFMGGYIKLESLNMVAPAPVPLPASVVLFLAALGGWSTLHYRARQASTTSSI